MVLKCVGGGRKKAENGLTIAILGTFSTKKRRTNISVFYEIFMKIAVYLKGINFRGNYYSTRGN